MNELKPFAMGNDEGSWRTSNFRQSVVAKIDEAIQRSGMPTSRNSIEMESHVFQKAKSKEDYLSMIARLILHVREMSSKTFGKLSDIKRETALLQKRLILEELKDKEIERERRRREFEEKEKEWACNEFIRRQKRKFASKLENLKWL